MKETTIETGTFEYDLSTLIGKVEDWFEEQDDDIVILSILIEPTETNGWIANIKYQE